MGNKADNEKIARSQNLLVQVALVVVKLFDVTVSLVSEQASTESTSFRSYI